MSRSVLLVGGARSGKSHAALKLAVRAARLQGRSVWTIATAEALDAEMAERILQHKRDRPASWTVVEEPLHLADAVMSVPANEILVVDCLTMWLSNRLAEGESSDSILRSARAVAIGLSARASPTVVVSNEVGLGIVPEHPLGRSFRDLQGRVNRLMRTELERSFLVVAGALLALDDQGWIDAEQVLS